MNKGGLLVKLGLVAAVAAASYASIAASSASQQIRLEGRVPTICNVDFDASVGQFNGSVIDLGSTKEFCNSGRGYKLYATANGAEGAALIVGGASYQINNGQEVLIVDSAGPARTSHSVAMDLGNSNGGGTLSFRIEAK